MRMARLGTGIAALTHHFAEPYLRSGELEPVLDEWSLPSVAAWAVFPGRRLMPSRTRAFLDALEAEFSGPKCQAQLAKERQTRRERFGRKTSSAP
jgi:DNA-binding transcriptional LysR family regulator